MGKSQMGVQTVGLRRVAPIFCLYPEYLRIRLLLPLTKGQGVRSYEKSLLRPLKTSIYSKVDSTGYEEKTKELRASAIYTSIHFRSGDVGILILWSQAAKSPAYHLK